MTSERLFVKCRNRDALGAVPIDVGSTIRSDRSPRVPKRDGGVPMSTILIVANQTLPSEALATEVTSRIASGARDFHIVVPATPPPGGGMTWDENAARAAAEERLAAFQAQLAGQGVTAGGEIGDRDPVAAVRDCARGRDVSEIILSTLPGGVSRWLRQDVPSRMKGAMNVPVTVVTEQVSAAAPT
jgi:hypothetical protein